MTTRMTGTRLPEDWQPGQLELDYIQQRHPTITKNQRDDLIADFIDYWLSEPDPHGRKVNWTRTFYTHVRRWRNKTQNPKPNAWRKAGEVDDGIAF
jgi:hypothetical protein